MSTPEINPSKSNVDFILLPGEENLEGCTLVGGYFGLGRVGYLSINHMLENLEVRLVGYVNSDFIPPFISIKDKKLRAPFEIFRHENLLIFATHFEPYKYEQRSIADAIVKWAKEKGIKSIIQIGGLDKRYQSDEEFDSSVVFSSHWNFEELGPKINAMDEGLYVTGPAALVMLYAEFYQMPALLLLPFAERARPDPKAASIAISTINRMFDIDCNVDALVDEAKSLDIEEQGAKEIAEKQELLQDSDRGMFV